MPQPGFLVDGICALSSLRHLREQSLASSGKDHTLLDPQKTDWSGTSRKARKLVRPLPGFVFLQWHYLKTLKTASLFAPAAFCGLFAIFGCAQPAFAACTGRPMEALFHGFPLGNTTPSIYRAVSVKRQCAVQSKVTPCSSSVQASVGRGRSSDSALEKYSCHYSHRTAGCAG